MIEKKDLTKNDLESFFMEINHQSIFYTNIVTKKIMHK